MADFEDSAARYEGETSHSSRIVSLVLTYNSDDRGYERRDRSASPRGDREDRNRSRSPNGRDRVYVSSIEYLGASINNSPGHPLHLIQE